ncbi:somatoliberin isoform X1 [Cyanistes caeruleus]|uniref:Somatoliberin n=1 Tax=Cyanistes caeruleus TaxID=156563 RepID=A0A8C0ZA32_CYACU|nr:somatoliberin isoform X1 [Cyanistes caeruleus]XP_023795676.1 somatoliberin isoform X1 [Cyanistes caeruleus]XP_023795678.1 somatoliberin isoform X1 [Cyanistes caeruleus]XP_023795679.1 somatoliberin isoform X1 [Cyanistes caeruleus]
MLDKATLLLFLHLVTCSISSPLYPALRYSPGPAAGKAMSFQLQHSSSLQSHNPLAEEQEEEGLLTDPTEKRDARASSFHLCLEIEDDYFCLKHRGPILTTVGPDEWMQRHADAIFTDNYRKFLGQISARKFLQTIIGKRLGSSESSPGEGVQEFLSRRQSDSILMDSQYHQQMVLRDFLGAVLQNQRPQDIDSSQLEGFPSTLAKLM